MMFKFYFEIWADAIEATKNSGGFMSNQDKVIVLLVVFSMAQGLNFGLILMMLSHFVEFPFFLPIEIFPGRILNNLIAGGITLFFPFILINYYLIVIKSGYEPYFESRRINSGGRVFIGYFIVSALLFLLIIIVGKWGL